MPEAFMQDDNVALHWKLYAIVNGFWISGKPVFASNSWFAEKLGCSERNIPLCFKKLEDMGLLKREVSGNHRQRTIVPTGIISTDSQDEAQLQGGDEAQLHPPMKPSFTPISVSNISKSIITANAEKNEDLEIQPDEDYTPSKKWGYQKKPVDQNAKRILQRAEKEFGFKSVTPAKEMGHIAAMVAAGYTQEQIFGKVRELQRDEYWFSKGLNFGIVRAQIGVIKPPPSTRIIISDKKK